MSVRVELGLAEPVSHRPHPLPLKTNPPEAVESAPRQVLCDEKNAVETVAIDFADRFFFDEGLSFPIPPVALVAHYALPQSGEALVVPHGVG